MDFLTGYVWCCFTGTQFRSLFDRRPLQESDCTALVRPPSSKYLALE